MLGGGPIVWGAANPSLVCMAIAQPSKVGIKKSSNPSSLISVNISVTGDSPQLRPENIGEVLSKGAKREVLASK